MQLAAQRIALNLREAGFIVQMANSNSQNASLVLRKILANGGEPAAALESVLRSAGQAAPVQGQSPAALFKIEQDFLNQKTLIPLLDLPRAYAISGRARNLVLLADGLPDLASASLEGSQ
jgi:hypothetical protein